MKTKPMLLIAAISLLAGCKKTSDGVLDNPPGVIISPNGGDRLIRFVYKNGNDSIVRNFVYDTAGRVLSENGTVTSSINVTSGYTNYERDAAGRILRIIHSNFPSVTTQVTYAGTTGNRILYTSTLGDSTAYEYNAEGRVRKISFYTPPIALRKRKLTSAHVWHYDAKGNIINLKLFGGENEILTSGIQFVFEYDSLPNPMYADDPARLLQEWHLTGSPNNLVKQVNLYTDLANPPDSNLISYKYRPDGKPISGIFKITDRSTGGFINTQQLSFYYK